jgi:uncharacterized DUF497 family protein
VRDHAPALGDGDLLTPGDHVEDGGQIALYVTHRRGFHVQDEFIARRGPSSGAPHDPAAGLPRALFRIYETRVFEWDRGKADGNQAKHSVSFEEAASAFDDPVGLDGADLRHSAEETRRLRLARSNLGRVLVIAYTRRGAAVRIISARRASRKERNRYAEAQDRLH